MLSIAAGLLAACLAADESPIADHAAELSATVSFDWTAIDDTFFLEVKNGTEKPFNLDAFFVEGYNIEIFGLNDTFKQIYKTPFAVRIDRGFTEAISISPGRFHRMPFRIEHLLKTMPEEVRYIKLKWTRNSFGDQLPREGIESSIYALRNPDKADASPTIDDDLAQLRNYDTESLASQEVMRSARSVFSQLSFVGLDAEQVIERLGAPHARVDIANRPVWRYSYHDGEQGVVRNLWFDFNGQSVWGIEPEPTQ